MSLRHLSIPTNKGSVGAISSAVNDILSPPKASHAKGNDLSGVKLNALLGTPWTKMADWEGEETVLVFDTETTCENGDNFGKPLIYDLGYTIVRKSDGVPVYKACSIIQETFTNAKLMKSAFFTNRVFTDYPYILNASFVELCSFKHAVLDMTEDIRKFNVKAIAAYNAGFDTNAFCKTAEYLNREYGYTESGVVSDIRNGNIDVLCLYKASCMSFMSHDEYKAEAYKHHWLTAKGLFQTSAEAANNFIHNGEVGEDHTALSDSAIEAEIYKYLVSSEEGREAMSRAMNGHGESWSFVNNVKGGAEAWHDHLSLEKIQELGV